ncbi:hypothetical protein M8J76_015008 [Diaphorina citri]|nr:hypothetical protein M8J76_015008 [Diaphorina citri]
MASLDITASAPGKIILCGEHSVVYEGYAALAASINRRTSCRLITILPKLVRIELNSLNFNHVMSLEELNAIVNTIQDKILLDDPSPVLVKDVVDRMMLRKIGDSPAIQNAMNVITFLLASMLSTMNVKLNTGLMLTISSELVLGAGSGSSASFAVSVAGAVYTLVKWLLGDVEDSNSLDVSISDSVNKWAFLAEQITHGKPSGLDNAVCTWGGLVKLKKLPLSTEISNVLWMGRLEILLIDTGVSRSTSALVQKVSSLKSHHETVVSHILTAMGSVTDEFLTTLNNISKFTLNIGRGENDDELLHAEFKKLEDLIDMNQGLLVSLGVSHPSLNQVIDICKGHDLHAKLTGAGGGGYAYALVPPYARGGLDACVRELERARYTVYRDIQLGGQGFELKIDQCHCVGLKDKVSL